MQPDRTSHFERPTAARQDFPFARRIIYLLFIGVIGVLSGALGFAILLKMLPRTELPGQYPLIVREGSGDATITQSALMKIEEHQALIIKKQSGATSISPTLIEPSAIVTSAVAFTSDGWFLTGDRITESISQFSLFFDGKQFEIEDRINDPILGITFVKVDAGSLIPVELLTTHPAAGDRVFAFDPVLPQLSRFERADIALTLEAPRNRSGYSRSLAQFSDYAVLSSPLAGRFLYSSAGSLVGMTPVDRPDLVVPARHLRISFEEILLKITEKDLGIFYVRADQLGLPSEGAVIYHPEHSAIVPRSRAQTAGLKDLDMIVSVNGDTVTRADSLQYLWRKHQLSSGLELEILRAGERVRVRIES